MPDSFQTEPEQRAYRQGYYDGVSEVISGVFERLSDEDNEKIKNWADKLGKWTAKSGDVPEFPHFD